MARNDTKARVTEALTEEPTILHTIELPDGGKIIDMVSNRVPGQQVAMVDFGTILRLAQLLPTADLDTIKRQFTEALDRTNTMEHYVFVLNEELAFHKTINLLQTGLFEIR